MSRRPWTEQQAVTPQVAWVQGSMGVRCPHSPATCHLARGSAYTGGRQCGKQAGGVAGRRGASASSEVAQQQSGRWAE